MIDIQTNSIIKFLTIFSAFMLPLTAITSFYGMNINLPFQDSPSFAYASMLLSVAILWVVFLYFQRKRKV
jgi:magnesium transporter